MSDYISDITLHINENTDHDERENLRDTLLEMDGVMAADCHDEKPHLIVIAYDPELVSSHDFLSTMNNTGMHAQLIGL